MTDRGGGGAITPAVVALTRTVAAAAPAARELPTIAELYARHFRRIWWVVRGAGVPDEAIEDVVHDVFVALHHRLGSYDGRLPLDRWLVGVARNAAFTHRRGAARRTLRIADVARIEVEAPDLDDHVARARAWRELQDFLVALPDDQREVFTLIELHGDTAPAVASSLDVKLNTVYARLRLARGKFDRWLAQHGHRDPQWTRDAADGGAPREAQRAGAWAAILASTRVPATVGVGLSTAKLAMVIGVLVGSGVVAATLRSDPAPRAELADTTDAAITPAPPAAVASATAPSPATVAPGAAPTTTPTRAAAPAPSRRPAPATAAVAPASDDAVDPADEQRWLSRAHEAIAAGDPSTALTWLDRHAHAFPRSALAPERVVLRVDALCRAGRRTDAEAAIAAWRRAETQPLPRIAARLESACD